jgi:uncharacterized hydrophobic protein (TIGR00271 family)
MRVTVFDNIKHEEKSSAIENLVKHSTGYQSFYFLVILSIFMATIGLIMNNNAVIIGSMLIAPVLYPILGMGMGIAMADGKLIFRSMGTFVKASITGIVSAIVVSLLMFTPGSGFELTPEILARTTPTLPNAAIAIIAGLAASFAIVKPSVSESLPGVAISVALVPPLAVVGIGIAHLSWAVTSGALVLFLTNTLGIIFASLTVFSIMNFYVKRNIAIEAAKKEDKELEKENAGKKKKDKNKDDEEDDDQTKDREDE